MCRIERSSLLRVCRRILSALAEVGRQSITGRALSALGVGFSNSASFGTGSIRSLPLETPGQSVGVTLLARLYVWLRRSPVVGGISRAFARLNAWSEDSVFRSGVWIRLIGVALLGMACGCVLHAAVATSAALAFGGLILALWGPWLLRTSRHGVVFAGMSAAHGTTSPSSLEHPADEKPRWPVWLGLVLCTGSGVVSGLLGSHGPVWLSVGVLVVAALLALLWRPEAILLVVAAFPWFDAFARTTFEGLGAAWDEILLLGSCVLLLWGALVTGRLRLRTVPIMLPTLCILTAAVGSVVLNRVPSDVGMFALRVVLEPLLFYFAGFLLFTTVRWLRRIVTVFLISATGLAAHGIYQFVVGIETPQEWLDVSETDITTRAFSVIGNPNGLGAILAVGLLVAIALLLSTNIHKKWRMALGVTIVLQVVGLAVTFSRSSWIGVFVGLLVLLLVAYRRYLLGAAALSVVGLLSTPQVFRDRLLLAFSYSYLSKASVDGRTYRWMVAYDHMMAHPWFGIGLGTFGGSAADRFGYIATWVDNYYLQMGAEGGLLLLAAFVWLLVRVAKGLIKAFKMAEDPFVRALAAGVFGALVAVTVANIFVSALETLALGAALWLLAGLATSAGINRETASSS